MKPLRRLKRKWLALGAAVLVTFGWSAAGALAQTTQTALPGSSIPQWVDPLPTLTGTGGLTSPNMESVVDPGTATTDLYMREFLVPVLPATTPFAAGTTYLGTSVFGYRLSNSTTAADTYIGPVFVTKRHIPTAVNYVNNLGTTSTTNVGVWKYSLDQTLHWADPRNLGMPMAPCSVPPAADDPDQCFNYTGPIPAVAHLHGGEVPAAIDGGPDAWFLSQAATDDYDMHGKGYYTFNYDTTADAGNNYSLYRYPNSQEAGPLWFHDHLLGGTRINVYAGLAGAYLLTDPDLGLPTGMTATGLLNGPPDPNDPSNNPTDELTIPLVLQDRMFDTTGQLYFPDAGLNPTVHPFWIPEFVGDTIVVNGKSWPFLSVEAKRYRFLMINGSNARTYEMFLVNPVTKVMGPPIWVIGTDGGYLDTPVKIDPNVKPNNKLIMMPGERYQVIIDFGGIPAGTNLILRNTGRTPYPKGAPPTGSTLGQIVQFRVGAVTSFQGPDPSYNPASYNPTTGANAIRTGTQTIKRLVTPPGTLNVTVTQNRQLTLNEVMGMGGPLEILVNNTKWNGKQPIDSMTSSPISGFSPDGIGNYLSELPAEGTTELWEIINLTADAHPIHLHLVQFQILNRQNFNVNNYQKAYQAAFPAGYDFTLPGTTLGGVYLPAFGPPKPYNTFPGTTSPITGKKIVGGNPDVTPYLQGMPSPSLPQEAGWKDTAIMYPGQVTRIAVRFSPTDTNPDTTASYPFIPNPTNLNAARGVDPATGLTFLDNYDFVWHCHIVDHEDNEMMRPYQVISSGESRSYINTGSTPDY
jgi:spore coat protein A